MSTRWRMLACLCAPALFAAIPAAAHAILVASTPAAGTRVAPGPVEIDLRYNSRIDAARSRVTLAPASAPPGAPAAKLPVVAGHSPAELQAHVRLAPGEYVLHWQVLAVDGHITRGDVGFSVAQ